MYLSIIHGEVPRGWERLRSSTACSMSCLNSLQICRCTCIPIHSTYAGPSVCKLTGSNRDVYHQHIFEAPVLAEHMHWTHSSSKVERLGQHLTVAPRLASSDKAYTSLNEAYYLIK
jgi:hypothetical protein